MIHVDQVTIIGDWDHDILSVYGWLLERPRAGKTYVWRAKFNRARAHVISEVNPKQLTKLIERWRLLLPGEVPWFT